MKKFHLTFIIVFIITIYAACSKVPNFPKEPVITFQSFTLDGNDGNLVLEFTDGDGNFGLDDSTWAGSNYNCELNHNLYCDYYELHNGNWVYFNLSNCPPNDPANVPYYYRVPIAEPTGQNKSQQGQIEVNIIDCYRMTEFDTCRFDVYVVDRDLNKSNTIQTPIFIKPD